MTAAWVAEAEALHRDCADGECVVTRLIAENRRLWAHGQSAANFWKCEYEALAARLAAVEALADEWENNEAYACIAASDCTRCVTYQGAVIRLRAVLSAAPTDTTKETS